MFSGDEDKHFYFLNIGIIFTYVNSLNEISI